MRQVLHRLFALVDKGRRHFAAHRALHRVGHRDAAGLGQRLQPGGDVHPVAIDRAVGFLDHVAQVHTDAKAQLPLVGQRAMRGLQLVLHGQSRRHRAGGGFEHGEHRVARHVDHAAVVGFDLLAKHPSRVIERGHRCPFVDGHQTRVARRIGGEDRLQALPVFAVDHRRCPFMSWAEAQSKVCASEAEPGR